ncbi:hypothetical protein SDC9_182409 [bioreactor metagenome]|uniref:Uncharacterized protein n=1 Tax=bioreactor metagenome TaxID=1076179 RepID=A0A645H7D5_9ZZZZ
MDEFTDTKTGGIQQFQAGTIPQPQNGFDIRCSHQAFDFIHREHFRQLLLLFRQLDGDHRIVFDQSFLLQVLMESPETGDHPSDRGCRQFFLIQKLKIQKHIRLDHIPECMNLILFQKMAIFSEVPLITGDGIIGQPSLDPQITPVCIYFFFHIL